MHSLLDLRDTEAFRAVVPELLRAGMALRWVLPVLEDSKGLGV